jgi:putative endonuclease
MYDGAYLYMLKCADGHYYVGTTRANLERRVAEHNAGYFGGYTSARLPVALVWSQHFANVTDAIAMERRLEGWRREKKEALIRGEYESLPAPSTSGGRRRPHPSTGSG